MADQAAALVENARLAEALTRALEVMDITDWMHTPMSNLRNGNLAAILNMAPSQSMEGGNSWVQVRGARYEYAERLVQAFIWAQYGQLVTCSGGDLSESNKKVLRKKAIVLGSARACIYGTYRLEAGDFNRSEFTGSAVKFTKPKTPEQVAAERAAMVPNEALADNLKDADLAARRAAVVPNAARVSFGNGDATNAARAQAERDFGALTPYEKKLAQFFAWIAAAVPPLQGVSLIHSGHHYIPPTYNLFEGILRQAEFKKPEDFADWTTGIEDKWKGWLFHDAAHPLDYDFKRKLAKDVGMKKRLEKSGQRAAAVRLPGLPADVQGLKAGLAVIKRAASDVLDIGITITTAEGDSILDRLEGPAKEGDGIADPETGERVLQVDQMRNWDEKELDALIAEGVAWFSKNQSHIAMCAGVVQQRYTAASLRAEARLAPETTLKAKSVMKAISNNISSYNKGHTYAEIVARTQKERLERGEKLNLAINV